MMIKSSNESDLQAGAAGINSSTIGDDESKALSISSSSTAGHTTSSSGAPWLRLKDPRIVRVSRAFGGKDRHSKVSTVRGLRDRRVRLSVPTAIQLYDLQDRLGLNQPSKVVDWLLTAAKHEIDELPPLPNIPPPAAAGPNFGLNLYHPSLLMMMSSTTSTSHHDDHQIGMDTANDEEDQKQKDHMSVEDDDHDDHQKQQGNVDGIGSSSNIHHHHHPMFFPGGLVNNAIPAPNYGFDQHNWEAHDHEQSSNFPVSHHLASDGFMTSQSNADHDHHHLHNFNVLPSTLSLSTGSQTQSYFPNSSHNATKGRSGDQIDPRHDQFNHIQMLSSSTSLYPNSQSQQLLMRAPGPHLSMMRKLVHEYSSHNTGSSINDEPNKDQLDSPSK